MRTLRETASRAKNKTKRLALNFLHRYWKPNAQLPMYLFEGANEKNLLPNQIRFISFEHADNCAREKLVEQASRDKYTALIRRFLYFSPRRPAAMLISRFSSCECVRDQKEVSVYKNNFERTELLFELEGMSLQLYKRQTKNIYSGATTHRIDKPSDLTAIRGRTQKPIPSEISKIVQPSGKSEVFKARMYRDLLEHQSKESRVLTQKYRALNQTKGIHGLGDFVFGCFKVFEVATQHGFLPEVDISEHPISKILASRTKSIEPPVNIFHEDSDFLFFRNKTVFTNKRPQKSPNISSRDFVLTEVFHFQEHYESEFQEFILAEKLLQGSYSVTHLRLGDQEIFQNAGNSHELDNIVRQLKNFTNRNAMHATTLFLADSEKIRAILSSAGLRTLTLPVTHLGNSMGDMDSVKNTLFEYRVMMRAREILQISNYPWGSAFSETAAILGAVPIKTVSLRSFMQDLSQ